jgi:hypothetical protein
MEGNKLTIYCEVDISKDDDGEPCSKEFDGIVVDISNIEMSVNGVSRKYNILSTEKDGKE